MGFRADERGKSERAGDEKSMHSLPCRGMEYLQVIWVRAESNRFGRGGAVCETKAAVGRSVSAETSERDNTKVLRPPKLRLERRLGWISIGGKRGGKSGVAAKLIKSGLACTRWEWTTGGRWKKDERERAKYVRLIRRSRTFVDGLIFSAVEGIRLGEKISGCHIYLIIF